MERTPTRARLTRDEMAEYRELAARQAYLQHRKDRQEVLQRHLMNARATLTDMSATVRDRVRLRAEGLLQGLTRLEDERLEREAAIRHPTARERAALRLRRHKQHVEVRKEIADLEERLRQGDEEEEEEELAGEDLPPGPSYRRDEDDEDRGGPSRRAVTPRLREREWRRERSLFSMIGI
jgi:hypothetical protein